MVKNSTKQVKRETKKAAIVQYTSEIVGMSDRSVRRVLNGDQENDKALAVYMEITERLPKLLDEVKKLVPFL